MKISAILDPGLRGPGILSRRIRLAGEDRGCGVWEGEIHPSRGLVMRAADSASVLTGRERRGWLSLFRTGRWDFLLDDMPVAAANVRRERRYGFEIGPVFHPVGIDEYSKMPVMEGERWWIDRGVMEWPDVRIEGDSMEVVLAVSGVVAFYEWVILSAG